MPLPENVREDVRTTDFLDSLPEDCLVVDRRHLTPVGASKGSFISNVGPVEFLSRRFVFKEPAVRGPPPPLLG